MKYKKNNLNYKKYGKGILFNNGIALNETASRIYELCDTVSDMNDLTLILMNEYDQSFEQIQSDVLLCINELQFNDLIYEEEHIPMNLENGK